MSIVFLANLSFIVIANILILGLGLYIYFNNRKDKANRSFLWISISLVSWLVSAFLGFMVFKDPSLCIILAKCNWASASLFMLAWYFFFVSFPREIKRPLILDKIVTVFWILFASSILLTDFFVQGIEIEKFGEWGSSVVGGPGMYLLYLTTSLFGAITLVIMIKRYFTFSREDRLKTSYLMIGMVFFYSATFIFNQLLPVIRGNHQYYQIGDYSIIIFVGFMAYSIIKRKLFSIKVMTTTIFIVLIFLLLLLDFFFSWGHIVMQIFKGMVLLFFIGFAYLLIESAKTEIKQREKLGQLNEELEDRVKDRTQELEEERDNLEIRVEARVKELAGLNRSLEDRVKDRTQELHERVVELEKFHRLTAGRETTMIELKKEIERVKKTLAQKANI